MNCKICGQKAKVFAQATTLDKYSVQYFRCDHCGFIQTEEPYWLQEAYQSVITIGDIGLIDRNLRLAKVVQAIILVFFNPQGQFVDYGGGYGLLVRMMRNAGLDFYRFDKFCDNLFANGFNVEEPGESQYELVTAFEVFEHLAQPLVDIQQMLQFSRNIFFSTTLVPANVPKPDEWWYYGLEHGQHVSLYTLKALSILAERFNLNLYSNGSTLHLLTEKRLPYPPLFKWIVRHKVAMAVSFLKKKTVLIGG